MFSEDPSWVHSLEQLWLEDDASRAAHDETRQRLSDAWVQLFNEEFPGKDQAIEFADLGDAFFYLFPEGRVACYDYMGEGIYQVTDHNKVPDTHTPLKEALASTEVFEPEEERPPKTYGELTLSDDQEEALQKLLDAIDQGQRVLVLKGPAGTGKTTLAIALSYELTARKWHIRYMAPTGKAASRLSEVVMRPATTIHSALFKSVKQSEKGVPIFMDPQQMTMGRVAIFCDEGSMVGRRLYSKMVENIGPQGVIVFMGDDQQLPPVADKWGPDFENPTAELTRIHRQAEDNPIISVATKVRLGESLPKESIGDAYVRHKGTLQLAARWMIREMNEGNDAIVLCYSNTTRRKINNLVRHFAGLKTQGDIVRGEQLVVLRNNKFVGRMNGETLIAESIQKFEPRNGQPDQNAVVIRSGDSAFFTKPELIGADRAEFDTVAALASQYTDSRLWVHLDYGYCLTVHKSQGSEYKKVLFVIDGAMRFMARKGTLSPADARRLCYTAITRAREQVIVLDTK